MLPWPSHYHHNFTTVTVVIVQVEGASINRSSKSGNSPGYIKAIINAAAIQSPAGLQI